MPAVQMQDKTVRFKRVSFPLHITSLVVLSQVNNPVAGLEYAARGEYRDFKIWEKLRISRGKHLY
jgi:hypothetical protein